MTDIQHAGYVISDIENNVIYGMGATVDVAWQQVKDEVLAKNPVLDYDGNPAPEDDVFETHYRVHSATQALLDDVAEFGGNIAWRRVDGVACTVEEVDA